MTEGEYRPTETESRSISFHMPAQTILYGGSVGDEANLSARDWRKHVTILTSELGTLLDKSDNSFHVVVAKNIDSKFRVGWF